MGATAYAMTELAKSFEPAAIEARWAPLWEAGGACSTLDPARPSFQHPARRPTSPARCTWHAFNHTIMDALTRVHRMKGFNTLWLPGTTCRIATQIVVERQLQDEGKSRHDIAAPPSWNACGSEGSQRQHHHSARCAGWATRWTGRASTSRWTRRSRPVNETFVRLYEGRG